MTQVRVACWLGGASVNQLYPFCVYISVTFQFYVKYFWLSICEGSSVYPAAAAAAYLCLFSPTFARSVWESRILWTSRVQHCTGCSASCEILCCGPLAVTRLGHIIHNTDVAQLSAYYYYGQLCKMHIKYWKNYFLVWVIIVIYKLEMIQTIVCPSHQSGYITDRLQHKHIAWPGLPGPELATHSHPHI